MTLSDCQQNHTACDTILHRKRYCNSSVFYDAIICILQRYSDDNFDKDATSPFTNSAAYPVHFTATYYCRLLIHLVEQRTSTCVGQEACRQRISIVEMIGPHKLDHVVSIIASLCLSIYLRLLADWILLLLPFQRDRSGLQRQQQVIRQADSSQAVIALRRTDWKIFSFCDKYGRQAKCCRKRCEF